MIHNQSSGKSRLIKKIISLGIAFLLICSVVIPAFAADVGSEGEQPSAQAAESMVQEESLVLEEKTEPIQDLSDEGNTENTESIPDADASAQEGTEKPGTAEPESTVTPQPGPAVTYNFYLEGTLYSSQVVEDGQAVVQPETPAADGKVFSGWYTAPDESGQKFEAFGAPSANGTETVTLYGRWETSSEAPENGAEPSADDGNAMEAAGAIDTIAGTADVLDADAGIEAFADAGSEVIAVGETVTLTSTVKNGSRHSWESDNTSVATVAGNGTSAVVTGIAAGEAIITHRYSLLGFWRSETYTINVIEAGGEEGSQVYYLKTPTSDPNSNDTSQWGENVGTARVNTTGAAWTNNKNIFNPSDYVVSWPDGTANTGSWLMPKDQYGEHYQAIYTSYRATLEKELGVTLNYENIEAIYLTPYKISRNNGTTPDKHIDCTISVKTKDVFAAVFWVTEPDGTVTQHDAKNYRAGSDVAKTTKAVDPTKIVGGVTYVFDGWYNEAGEKISDEGWPYTPNEGELYDGTVNFYASYIPQNTSVTVSKTVTGGLGDRTKAFSFTAAVQSNGSSVKFKIGETEYTGTADFTLQDGQSITLDVPAGAAVTITEADYSSERYVTTYSIDGSASEQGNAAVISSASASGNSVAFTNHKDVAPDTGLNLTAIPNILMLVFAAVGGLMLIIGGKRRI